MAELNRSARSTALRAATLALEKKAEDVLVIEIGRASNVADYLVICSGMSDVHVRAVAEFVRRRLSKEGVRSHHTEGAEHGHWALTDFIDVVVHVMQPKVREYYNLEGLWADCPQKRYDELSDPMVDIEDSWGGANEGAQTESREEIA
ncbi:MAG: ribosome silencing factor [Gemmatimonadetes bacterium]|nr:ribosome silencing factor [Gemmatimonadota bacterium]